MAKLLHPTCRFTFQSPVVSAPLLFFLPGFLFANPAPGTPAATTREVGLCRTFERSVTNTKTHSNKFADVELRCSYTSPSGKTIDFSAFFGGDGKGGGNESSGIVWKLRCMSDEPGEWNYAWSWSDGTAGVTASAKPLRRLSTGTYILHPVREGTRSEKTVHCGI